MAESYTPRRRRGRSKREINRYWNVRHRRFLKYGFTEEEATLAADQGLALRNWQVKELLYHRKGAVKWYIRQFGYDWDKAVEMASEDLRTKVKDKNTDFSLFYETSP